MNHEVEKHEMNLEFQWGKLLENYTLNTETKYVYTKKKKHSVALVRERTIPTERPLPVGEVSANFCG